MKPAGDWTIKPRRRPAGRLAARRNWELLAAGVPTGENPDLLQWLQEVARAMLAAEALPGSDSSAINKRRQAFVDASGMGGKAAESDPGAVTLALRAFQASHDRGELQPGDDPVAFVSRMLGWPESADAEKRIQRALKTFPPDVQIIFSAIKRTR